MKYAKSASLLLSMALLTGCGQSANDALNTVLGNASTKVSNLFAGAPDPELLKLKEQLEQAQQQLLKSNTQLAAANAKLKNNSTRAKSLQREYALLKQEGAAIADTTRHVRILKQRLSNQSSQLSKLEKTLTETAAGCKAIAEEFGGKKKSSSPAS